MTEKDISRSDVQPCTIVEPTIEEEAPPASYQKQISGFAVFDRSLTQKEINSLKQQSDASNSHYNQKLARKLIAWMVAFLILLCAAAFILSFWVAAFKDVFENLFQPVQYAFFTFLGFLFGDKGSNGK